MAEKEQVQKLSSKLSEMNNLLEEILHIQFGIENDEWIQAISQIENGFSKAVSFIAKEKGKYEESPAAWTKEETDEILEA